MSTKKTKTLFFIADYLQEKGFPPTLEEIKNHLGLKSIRGAELQIEKLQKEGYVTRQPYISRGIKLNYLPPSRNGKKIKLPIIGEIKAGTPSLAESNIEGYVEVEEARVRGRKDAFLLRVRGDSMIGKGIYPGDLAIITPTSTAEDGDIVVAFEPNKEVGTLKIFKKLEDYVALLPANPKYKPILGRNFLIQGKFLDIFREG